jgi:hypothetical protein
MLGVLLILSHPKPAAVAPNPNQPAILAINDYVEARAPFRREAQLAATLTGLFLSVVLLVDGIGLLFYQPWARFVAIGYGVLSILYQASWLLYAILCILPLQLAFYNALPAGGAQAPGPDIGGRAGAACGDILPVLGLIYPAIVLVVMLLPSVAAAFQSGRTADDLEGRRGRRKRRQRRDYDDDDADDNNEAQGYEDDPDDRFGPAR